MVLPAARVFNVLEKFNGCTGTTPVSVFWSCLPYLIFKTDIVVTVADRFETMATTITASYMNIPLAHSGRCAGNG
jgi:hypothetical protein